MKVLTVDWFNALDTPQPIGLVIAENEAKEKHAYIGLGRGENEDADINKILTYGAKMPIEYLTKLSELIKKL